MAKLETPKTNLEIEQISNTIASRKNNALIRLLYKIFIHESTGEIYPLLSISKEVKTIMQPTSEELDISFYPYRKLKNDNLKEYTKQFATANVLQKAPINFAFERTQAHKFSLRNDLQTRLTEVSLINAKNDMLNDYSERASKIAKDNGFEVDNPLELENRLSNEFKDLFTEAKLKTMIRASDNLKVKQLDGKEWKLETWYNRELSTMTKALANDNTTEIMRAYDWDLVFINNNAVCSPLCINAQGKIYSEFGKTPGYPLLSSVTTKSKDTWLFHPHCYHEKNVYIKGISEDLMKINSEIPEKTIDKNYQKEQRKRYVEREIRNTQDKMTNIRSACELQGVDYKELPQYQRLEKRNKELIKLPHQKSRLINNFKKPDDMV